MSRLRRAKCPPAPEISGGTKELASLSQTCHMCPSQWEGRTVDGEYVYIRFRWGTLTLGFGPDAVLGPQAYCEQVGRDEWDGAMDTGTMLGHLRDFIRYQPPPATPSETEAPR